jgi:hypothetical protein
VIPATLKIKNPLKAGRNTKGKSDGGSRNGPKVEGLAACDAVAATPLMDWIMSPSSGQAIIWRDRKDSNLRPFG